MAKRAASGPFQSSAARRTSTRSFTRYGRQSFRPRNRCSTHTPPPPPGPTAPHAHNSRRPDAASAPPAVASGRGVGGDSSLGQLLLLVRLLSLLPHVLAFGMYPRSMPRPALCRSISGFVARRFSRPRALIPRRMTKKELHCTVKLDQRRPPRARSVALPNTPHVVAPLRRPIAVFRRASGCSPDGYETDALPGRANLWTILQARHLSARPRPRWRVAPLGRTRRPSQLPRRPRSRNPHSQCWSCRLQWTCLPQRRRW